MGKNHCRMCGGTGRSFLDTCSRCGGCGIDPGFGVAHTDNDFDADAFAASQQEEGLDD